MWINSYILNQGGAPAMLEGLIAQRPTEGVVGRIYISTDTFAIYRDTGTGWDLIAGPGTGTVTGSGISGQLALWNGTQVLTGDTGITFSALTKKITASGFIVSGGTSAQFQKADGSLDGTSYAPASALGDYLLLAGGTLTGVVNSNSAINTSGIITSTNSLKALGSSSLGVNLYLAWNNSTAKGEVVTRNNAGYTPMNIYASDITIGDIINNNTTTYHNGNVSLSQNGSSARYLAMLNADASNNGSLILQSGGGSIGFGGSLVMFGHSHATKPGWVVAGISSASGGKFTVQDAAIGSGTVIFSVTQTGIASVASRLNVNGATDNSLFSLNVNGTVNGSAPSFTGNTYTVTGNLSAQFYHVFTGAVGQTLTAPTPSGNNNQYLIINNSANILTVAAFSGTNIITTLGATSATITLAANARTLLVADGNNKYYQAF